MTAKPNNGVSCAARRLRHSPAPRGEPSATLCGWHCVRGQRGRGVRVRVWTQQLVLVPPHHCRNQGTDTPSPRSSHLCLLLCEYSAVKATPPSLNLEPKVSE